MVSMPGPRIGLWSCPRSGPGESGMVRHGRVRCVTFSFSNDDGIKFVDYGNPVARCGVVRGSVRGRVRADPVGMVR